ncbi:MAG: type 1 glutamine amidotransferase [Vulcanimicrobiota bacterium]
MKVLLFQIRDEGDPMRAHEELCFERKLAQAPPFELGVFCLLSDPYPPPLDDYDVFMVGGSGSYGCVNNVRPWFGRTVELFRQLVEQKRPLFCSCFGHQALAAALGGEVVTDRQRSELGTFEIALTEQGQKDPLFGQLPPTFTAQLGHNDHVQRLPRGAVLLASSERSPIQAYRLDGLPVYATQFHPEMDHLENTERAGGYLHVYDDVQKTPERIAQAFRESPEAIKLIPRFVQLVRDRALPGV